MLTNLLGHALTVLRALVVKYGWILAHELHHVLVLELVLLVLGGGGFLEVSLQSVELLPLLKGPLASVLQTVALSKANVHSAASRDVWRVPKARDIEGLVWLES
jgi:hypothetical protein